MKDKGLKGKDILFATVLVIVGILYYLFVGDGSYAMYKDSATFIEWSYDGSLQRGYILYPLFLRTCRGIFGEALFLQAANVIQCLLALITSLVLEEYVRKTYKLGYVSGFVSFMAICGVYSYSLPEVVASHYLVTESLTFPLFSLMLVFLLKYINEHSFFPLIFALCISWVMILARPQMVFFVPILIFIAVLNEICRVVARKKVIVILALPAFAIATIIGLYFVVLITVRLFGGNANSQYHEAVMGKVMCVMDEEDSAIQDDDLREGFELLYEDTRKNGGLTENFPASILEYEKVQRIIDMNMHHGLDVIWEWYDAEFEPVNRDTITYARNSIISKELSVHKTEYIGVILRLLPASLVSSIFIQPPQIRLICNIITLALYMSAIVLVYVAYFKDVERKYYVPMLVSLIMIYGNALLSNIVLYGQQRYVVYCFGIFYISGLIILKGIYDKIIKSVQLNID